MAVLAHKSDFLPSHQFQIQPAQHMLLTVVLVNVFHARHHRARMRRRRKLEAHAPRVLVVNLNDVDLVELLDQTLRKGRLGRLVAEAFDQLLRLLDFALLIGLGLALLLANFIAQRQILVVGAGKS